MNMGMSLQMEPRIEQECVICKQSLSNHKSSCPAKKVEDLCAQRMYGVCPKCGKHEVEANKDDFLECVACGIQYTRSPIAPGEDPDTLEKAYVLFETECPPVLVMKTPGKGMFPLLEAIEKWCGIRDKAREKAELRQECFRRFGKDAALLKDMADILEKCGYEKLAERGRRLAKRFEAFKEP